MDTIKPGGGGVLTRAISVSLSRDAERADSTVMLFAEAKRAAGVTPSERAEWAEYRERCRRGEVHP